MGGDWLCSGAGSADETVSLPHCWNAGDSYDYDVVYYRGDGSYRKLFRLPAGTVQNDEIVWSLESEGFYGTGSVWLNGHKLADVDGQYLGFSLETGKHLLFDSENTIGVRLTNRCEPHVLPGIDMPDFILYGGLSGRMWLEGRPAVHLDLKRTAIRCREISKAGAKVGIQFVLANRGAERRRCIVNWVITNGSGKEVCQVPPVEVYLKESSESGWLFVEADVPNPELWGPDNPALYTAVCSVTSDGRVLDREPVRFGIRDAAFLPRKGFFLNGERVELRGCNRHESMPGFGRALPAGMHREDAKLMKGMGINFVRLSHYPQHPEFLDACDELGIMVYAEIASWKSVRTGRWLESACRQMNDMIARDRNHPSVILWGMGNESRSAKAYTELGVIARTLDPGRPVTYAENHFYRAKREKTTGVSDVWGLNYELAALEDGCNASRLKNVVVSECSNYPQASRGNYPEELKQIRIIESDLAAIANKPEVAVFALWSWNDYGTLRKDRYRRHCGIVDAWHIPKMSAAFLRAKYGKEPFLKLFGDWSDRGKAGPRDVNIFTNCDKVVLTMSGREIAVLDGKTHLVQEVEFNGRELDAKGTRQGQTVTDKLVPFGAARRISIAAEEPGGKTPAGGTVALAFKILDEAGNLVTDWKGDIGVKVAGPGVLMSYSQRSTVMISGGTGRGFVASTGKAGEVRVSAEFPGLEPGAVSVCPAALS
jgi:beta-galactosidase